MNRNFLCGRNLGAKLCFSMLGLVLFVSCTGKVEQERALFAKDPGAVADLGRINAELAGTGRTSNENFEKLKALHSRFPNLPDIAKTYRSALAGRQEWEALEKALNEIPPAGVSRDDRVLLANVYVRSGKFAESLATLASLGPAGDIETRSLSAISHFNLGQLNEAAADLDPVWSEIVSQKRVDDINLRGLIYFRAGDYAGAVATLLTSLSVEPNNAVATNSLSRVYAAMGDSERAESHRQATAKTLDQKTSDEGNKMQFVSLSRKLESAWNEKRFKDVLTLANQMLEISDDKNKAALQSYIARAETELKRQNAQ